MELKFDANQDFQLQAIEAVTSLFAGQPRIETDLHFTLGQSPFTTRQRNTPMSVTPKPIEVFYVHGRYFP